MTLAGDDAVSAIKTLLKRLKQRNAEAAKRLLPGRKDGGEQLKRAFPQLTPTEDMVALWREMDGVDIEGDPALEALWLDGTNAFLSEEEAVEDYMMAARLQQDEPDFAQYWPRGFVPIASPGDGSRLLVNCLLDSPTFGALYMLDHGVGLSRMARSLGQYFETMLDWLDTNAMSVDPLGVVRTNDDDARQVARTMNPDCDAWDDAMPPAHETRDWVAPNEGK